MPKPSHRDPPLILRCPICGDTAEWHLLSEPPEPFICGKAVRRGEKIVSHCKGEMTETCE